MAGVTWEGGSVVLFCALGRILTTSMAFRGFVLMTSFLALRASVCIFLWCLFNYFARFGLDGTATWMEQLPGLDTAARMEQLPGWNNYLGSILPRLDRREGVDSFYVLATSIGEEYLIEQWVFFTSIVRVSAWFGWFCGMRRIGD